ncbi:MAG: hypothetical protein R2822_17005 [Spirosomataceae bacterium]
MFAIVLTVGVGLTVTVKVLLTPGQPAKLGITVTVAVTGDVPPLVAVKAEMLPVPDVPKPMLLLLEDQENVAHQPKGLKS